MSPIFRTTPITIKKSPEEKNSQFEKEWPRGDLLGLSAPTCNICIGLGFYLGRHQTKVVCKCVLRQVFRSCYNKYKKLAGDFPQFNARHISQINFINVGQYMKSAKIGIWGRKDEEFIADFFLISKRTLNGRREFSDEETIEWRIFKYHFLLGAEWKFCCQKLKMDRGNFFHAIYRIEAKLGEVFKTLKPYPLYSPNSYFYGDRKPPSLVLYQQPIGFKTFKRDYV